MLIIKLTYVSKQLDFQEIKLVLGSITDSHIKKYEITH
jgi:hypothetical protein